MKASSLSARILENSRCAGISLGSEHVAQLEQYYRLLAKWNDRINLTALELKGFSDHTLERLIVEPLLAAPYIDERQVTWFDIGSGGGSPAIPLKILRPASTLLMVESRQRKGAFLREVVSNLGLTASVLSSRFEALDWDNRTETADIVTIRAVKLSRELSESTSMALKSTGRLLLFHSPSSTIAGNSHLRLVDDFPLGKLGSRLAILEKK